MGTKHYIIYRTKLKRTKKEFIRHFYKVFVWMCVYVSVRVCASLGVRVYACVFVYVGVGMRGGRGVRRQLYFRIYSIDFNRTLFLFFLNDKYRQYLCKISFKNYDLKIMI